MAHGNPGLSLARSSASPGLAMLLRTAMGSFLFHFCNSSCILSILAGLRAHRQPLREELPDLFSTFSKHLLRDRLWRTEFFQPSGAVCQSRARQEFRLGSGSRKTPLCICPAAHSGARPPQHPAYAWYPPVLGRVGRKLDHKLLTPKICLHSTLSLAKPSGDCHEVTHKGRDGGCCRDFDSSPTSLFFFGSWEPWVSRPVFGALCGKGADCSEISGLNFAKRMKGKL